MRNQDPALAILPVATLAVAAAVGMFILLATHGPKAYDVTFVLLSAMGLRSPARAPLTCGNCA